MTVVYKSFQQRARPMARDPLGDASPVGPAAPGPGRQWDPAWGDVRGALPPDDFATRLRLEKRRSDRNGRPLSLAMFQVSEGGARKTDVPGRLLELLHQNTRETDAIGHVGPLVMVVLCPETDEAGVRALIDKIDALATDMPYAATTALYPDALFDQIAGGASPAGVVRDYVAAESAHALSRAGYVGKRTLDIVGALLGLVLLSPVMLLVALAVLASSPGPVLFRQPRLGKGGERFSFLKFRSMRVDGDDSIHRQFVADLIAQGQQASGEFKLRRDPRITPIGHFIRRTSIDELPQLWNVLCGHMSLVGPRPPIPYETEHYQAWHLRRILAVKPGLTGIWQVHGRSRVTFNEMVRMDLRYVRDCSLLLDLQLLLRTVKVVVTCDGAR